MTAFILVDVTIETFSYPATKVEYPALTVCKRRSYNVDEYVRSVFDNFQVVCTNDASCDETLPLREDYPHYLQVSMIMTTDEQPQYV